MYAVAVLIFLFIIFLFNARLIIFHFDKITFKAAKEFMSAKFLFFYNKFLINRRK